MRRLLMDEAPLLHTVNRRLKLKFEFRWFGVFGNTSNGLLIWAPTSDPDMFSRVLASKWVPQTPEDTRLLTVASGNLDKFLRQHVIVQSPTDTVNEQLTVHGLIGEFANKLGGVHVDVKGTEIDILNRALDEAPGMVFAALATVGRIIVRAIEPLSAKVFEDAQATSRGPGYRLRLRDPDLA